MNLFYFLGAMLVIAACIWPIKVLLTILAALVNPETRDSEPHPKRDRHSTNLKHYPRRGH